MSEFRPKPKEQKDHDMPSPGSQVDMKTQPDSDLSNYKPADKLKGKSAIITGGDSGIGRAVALAFAMEGAKVAIVYDQSDDDANETKRLIEAKKGQCVLIKNDVSKQANCKVIVAEAVKAFGGVDVLVNNAANFEGKSLETITQEVIEKLYSVNVFGYLYMIQAALPYLEKSKGNIINTSSTTSILGKKDSLAYASSKGAVNILTKTASLELVDRGIRVNAVLPGPFWTPAIATSDKETTKNFGSFTMMKRAGQPEEIAPVYVHLAAEATFTTGALYEVTGGFRSVDAHFTD